MRTLAGKLFKNAVKLSGANCRFMSSSGNLTNLEVNDKTGIATLTLNRPPVNGLNLDILTEIKNALGQVENNKSKGMILTSSSNSVFSGGLDILEMYNPKMDRLIEFWTALQDVWIKLYGSSFPTAAAINGHSPAGGCLLAMSCEYRVMLPNFTIGLNETQLGFIPPIWFIASMRNTIPSRAAELAVTRGHMFGTDEALNIGLIDEVAKDKTEAISKCESFLLQFNKVSSMARALTKQSFRQSDLDYLINNREKDLKIFTSFVSQPKVQKGLELYLESLKKRKSN